MTLHDVGRPPPGTIGPEQNVYNFFAHWARRAPDRPAIVFPRALPGGGLGEDEVVTFAQLARDAGRVAAGLAALGVRQGDRVLCFVPMSRPLYALLIGLLQLGACAVFVDPWVPLEQIGRAVVQVEPRAFVGVPRAHLLRLVAPSVRRIHVHLVAQATSPLARLLGPSLESLLERAPTEEVPLAWCGLDETALVTFTTGSTGTPKGSNRTQRFMNAQGVALDRHLPRRPGDVDMPALPIFVLNNLGAGVPSVLPLVDFRRIADVDPALIVDQVRRWRVTSIGGSPSYLLPIAEHCQRTATRLDTVRGVVAGGAPVPARLLALLRDACPNARGSIEVLYGSTEAEPVASIEADEVLRETAALAAQGHGTCVGRAADGVEVKVVTAREGAWTLEASGWRGVELPPGTPGELLVTGEHVQKAYWRNPRAVAENKVMGPDGRTWHRMGDLGYQDAQGRLWLVGRVREEVWTGERALYPLQVEGLVDALPGVRRSALVAVRGEPVVVVVPASAPPPGLEARVLDACAAAGFAVARVLVRDALPLDPRHNAKIERARLREMLERGAA
jgi:acyl-CoA synthetase (AMP-forming)/AMP-acid ligase II